MESISYEKFEGFENVFLEDSFVLDLKITPLTFIIDLEIILAESHSLYTKPLKNELYCYRKAQISFLNVESVIWTNKISKAFTDATGEIDFGNIDEFILENGIYKIWGDLGNFEIKCEKLNLEIF